MRGTTTEELFRIWQGLYEGKFLLGPASLIVLMIPPEGCEHILYRDDTILYYNHSIQSIDPVAFDLGQNQIVNLERFDWKIWRWGMDIAAKRIVAVQMPILQATLALDGQRLKQKPEWLPKL